MFIFATLDPRNIPAATEANDKVFAQPVYGIEVTVPALAKRCAFNLDPQHTGSDTNRAAIEDALTTELPTEGIDPPIHRRRVGFFTHHREFDISKARRLLGYAPRVGIQEGIERTIRWYIQQGYMASI